tara:strand:- start:48 stop:305 length:258 start_codon:yes stop_codon:yes gene_type:complete
MDMSNRGRIAKYLRVTRIKRAFTSRAISVCVTFIIIYVVTGNIKTGVLIGSIDTVIKLCLYYWHETFWENKITVDIKKIKLLKNE